MEKNSEEKIIFAELRKQKIADLIKKEGKVTVAQLCDKYSVSPATIRNDLTELDNAGVIKRTHGGAIRNIESVNYELVTEDKEVRNVEEKVLIAKEAVKYIHEGEAILLDTGTTTFELAKMLRKFSYLTVVTNDLGVASFLEKNTNFDIYVLGGRLRKGFSCTVGDSAIRMLDGMHVDTAFLAANGIDLQRGISTPGIEVAEVKRKMIYCAERTILLSDSSKFQKNSFAIFADVQDIDLFITDKNLKKDILEMAEQKDIMIKLA